MKPMARWRKTLRSNHISFHVLFAVAIQSFCCADATRLSSQDRGVLQDSSRFHEVHSTNDLPREVVALVASDGRLANPGEKWNATDSITDPTLPDKRLIWAAVGGAYYAVHYECKDTLKQIRKCGSDGFLVQADVTRPHQITEMFCKVRTEFGQLIRNWHIGGWTPMGRLGTPADIGDIVALFCSEKARWITRQIIYADGGASLMNPEVPPEIQIG
jgi:Enoyl-(Acyl carrier protein) reductase